MPKFLAIMIFAYFFSPVQLLSKNFEDYLSYVNKAEISIVKDSYKQAQIYYDSAFRQWDKPFAYDLYNDMKCANLDSDFVTVKTLAESLIALGCPLSFFDEADNLLAFRHSVQYHSVINDYSKIRVQFLKKNNWALRSEIETLKAKDQVIRNQSHGYTVFRDSVYRLDDTIKADLIHIFKNKFPNEYDYGVFLDDDTSLAAFEPLHLVILHNYQKFDTATVPNANLHTHDFTPVLMDAVKKGDMHPQEFAYLNDRSGAFMIGKGYWQQSLMIKLDNKKLYFMQHSSRQQSAIDSNRMAIVLDSYDDEKTKALYSVQHKGQFILFRCMERPTIYWKGMQFPEQAMKHMLIDTGLSAE